MTLSRQRRRGTVAFAVLTSGLLLAGCASGGGSSSGPQTDPGAVGVIGDQTEGGTPVQGGTLSFAGYAPVASLDPTKTQATGSTGGTEMAAVYDLLVRYDSASDSYEPQLAKALTSSDDFKTWTLELRDGVTFSDGTPLDAKAVVASTNRFNERKGGGSQAFTAGVKSVEATNDSTVVYTMNQSWSEFPALLVYGHGMVVAPSSDQPDGTFKPIGAGAFTLESLTPGADVVMKARPDYFNGKPPLDTLKFVTISDEQPKVDALNAGGLDMAYLRDAAVVDEASANLPGYYETSSLSAVVSINQREGRPAADLRVRKAMQLAVDPVAIDQRARGGKGMPGTEIFQPWSKWHNDIAPVEMNTEEAKALVDAAKADGFSGNMTYFTAQTQAAQATALTIQAMLAPIGINVEIDYAASVTDIVKRLYIDKDFDIATGALSIQDTAPFQRLYGALNSTSTNNIGGVNDPKMDEIVASVQTATNDEAKLEALSNLQVEVNENVPFLALASGANFLAWTDSVHGAVPSLDAMVLLDKAWIE
ncbi:ABC transporter substrate-binding protein [Rhodococcus sp. PAMC28707]|uniref:ABC transporter substrate-binding protein n=1 Tax=unclassified Rhodococcus (in: high G+C Gram-positive bacteria) TaxID=192944 RepID=UPI00109DA8D0|nr:MULTISPECIES: ABC transporter substrate-binding protein [unclassified Rhodococcus (in: high G+C Gram-positive bacteria)]QCB49208.1 ABC transporter substrate-binding protein [Rhodococcus sp. PAMC28705]QCB59104.1 ABC transporter substrate-binding protein [Rhodococcus sp. PAMC28707]